MENKVLSFDTGVVKYHINDTFDVCFNPTDTYFVNRFYEVFEKLDQEQSKYEQEVEARKGDYHKTFEYAKTRDLEMRGLIDDLLGEGASDALFPGMNCYSLASGLPVWMNLLFAIADEIHDAYQNNETQADPRVRNYNNKYNKLMAKYAGTRSRGKKS